MYGQLPSKSNKNFEMSEGYVSVSLSGGTVGADTDVVMILGGFCYKEMESQLEMLSGSARSC